MCCNTNLCNPDSNVENLTEVNKKATVREDMLVREGVRTQPRFKGGSDGVYDNVDILSDNKKK